MSAARSKTSKILGGTVSPADPAAVALRVGGELSCSGALVSPDTVLTAAHCIPPANAVPLEKLRVAFGPDALAPQDEVGVTQAWLHPDWRPLYEEYDIAALRLARPVNVEPYLLPDSPLDLHPGVSVRAVGFGATDVEGSTGHGHRRAAPVSIQEVTDEVLQLSPPIHTCAGDSGGPLVVSVRGDQILAGLHARSDCQTGAIATPVEPYLDEIFTFIEQPPTTPACSISPTHAPPLWTFAFVVIAAGVRKRLPRFASGRRR